MLDKILTPEVRTVLKALALAVAGAVVQWISGVLDQLGNPPV